ncbi:MAG: flippase-like domain-containing protein [Flavobacteriales bacterium]|nr:flippase-like domain-containing protein [Flavobacteriales bacterium]MCB9165911.1 flippase-like domain-containing protein [Flavobacteriales bacterium]
MGVLHRSIGSWPLRIARWSVFVAACVYLYHHLAGAQGTLLLPRVGRTELVCILAAFLGVALNWGLEAWKWRRLIAAVVHVPFIVALRATLAGTTIGLITPNRTGEFIGRVALLPVGYRAKASFVTMLGSAAQFVVTILMGGSAMVLFHWTGTGRPCDGLWWYPLLVGTFVLGTVTLAVLMRPSMIIALVALVPFPGHRALLAARALRAVDRRTILATLASSIARYIVFAVQFTLLLHALAGVAWGPALLTVAVIFLCTTLIPTAVLTEIGVRGSVAMALLGPNVSDPAGVAAATLLLWTMNLALPALVGGVVLLLERSIARRSVSPSCVPA